MQGATLGPSYHFGPRSLRGLPAYEGSWKSEPPKMDTVLEARITPVPASLEGETSTAAEQLRFIRRPPLAPCSIRAHSPCPSPLLFRFVPRAQKLQVCRIRVPPLIIFPFLRARWLLASARPRRKLSEAVQQQSGGAEIEQDRESQKRSMGFSSRSRN